MCATFYGESIHFTLLRPNSLNVNFPSELARLTCIRMVLFDELDVSPPDLLFGCGDWEVQCFEVGGILGSGSNASETNKFFENAFSAVV